jgi:regulator of protease activity HflC (stomatin/prohibitin superfamily)
MKLTPRKLLILVGSVVAVLGLVTFSSSILETNLAGRYQVKQAAVSGDMSVRNEPGVYGQMFGDIYTYQISDMNYFSKSSLDGGEGEHAAPIGVRFNDGGTADVSGSIKFRLSLKEENQLQLHTDFKGYSAVQADLVRQVITESLMQTATLMKAEESYSTRRSEFTALAEEQIVFGIYDTTSIEREVKDAEGNLFVERSTRVKTDSDGKPVIRKISPFRRYDIEVIQFVIKDIDFDKTIDALIAKKKEAEQAKVVARAKAEEAKQDAITAAEQGKARIAKAEADELVEKIKATTKAQKEFEVAQFNRKKADEDAKARLTIKRAEADAAKLLVAAGLTPLDRATIQKETAIGVAAELSKLKLPSTFIAGGSGGSGGGMDPFTAIGLNQLLEIQKKLVDQNKSK